MKNPPTNVSTAVHAPYAITSAPSHRRADGSRSSAVSGGAAGRCGSSREARVVNSAATATAAGTTCAARHDSHSVIAPTSGLTTIQASAFAPAT